MKIQNALIPLFAACAAAFAEPENAAGEIEAARAEMKAAFASFSDAQNLIRSADSIFSAESASLSQKEGEFRSLASDFAELENSAQSLKRRIAAFKTGFAADVEGFKSAKSTLEDVEKILPMARAKIKSIEAAIEALRPKVAQNPGNMYQDKREFESVQADFQSASASLKSAEEFLSSTLVNISVATPKMEGVAPAVGLAEDYAARLESLNAENSEKIGNIKAPLEELAEQYARAGKELARCAEDANGARAVLMKSYGKLADLVLNKIPASGKFADAEFSRVSIFSALPKISAGKWERGVYDAGFAAADAADDRFAMKSKRESARTSTALYGAPSAMRNSPAPAQKPQNLRAEFLGEFSKISNAAFEIREAAEFLRAAANEAQLQNAAIDADINAAQSLSMDAISLFSRAQAMQSRIQTAETSNKILESRRAIFKAQFEKLAEAAAKKTEDGVKKAKAAAESAEKIASEI